MVTISRDVCGSTQFKTKELKKKSGKWLWIKFDMCERCYKDKYGFDFDKE